MAPAPNLPPLPTPLTRFFGRAREIADASSMMQTGQTRLLTLVGPGGVGKTRLGLEIAATLHDHCADGVLFVPLGAIRDTDVLLSTLVLSLGIEGDLGVDRGAQLRAFLQSRAMLLLLDNVEQIPGAGPTLRNLLSACPHLQALVTSRVPLRVAGEHRYPVEPLPVPVVPLGRAADFDLGALTETAAIALFADRATAVNPRFVITTTSVRAVAEICRRSDGLPLAIELAAARLRILAPGELAERLEPRLPLLSGGPRDQPDRLRTMRNAIAWSYDLLKPEHQALFRRLSVFTGGFGFTAVERMTDEMTNDLAVDILGELIDATLVQRIDGSADTARFAMLETIREFGLEVLSTAGEEAASRDRHAAWCLDFAEYAGRRLAGPDHLEWWQRIEADLANIRQAQAWFVQQQDAEQALRLGVALDWFWAVAGYYGEGRVLYRTLAAMPNAERFPGLLARVLGAAGNLEHWLNSLDEAEALNQRALTLHHDTQNHAGMASTLRALGSVAVDRGDLEKARSYLAEAQTMALAAGADWDLGAIANLQAIVAFGHGDYAAAMAFSTTAIQSWHLLNDTGHVAAAQINHARAALASGQTRQAGQILGQVLEVLQADVGDDAVTSDCFEVVAGLGLEMGAARPCLLLLAAADAMFERIAVKRRAPFAAVADRLKARARGQLGDRETDVAWAQGAAMQIEEALHLARVVAANAGALASASHGALTGILALTPREREVLRLVARGLSDKEIAVALDITRYTVSNHVANIRLKLDAPSRAAVAAVAVRDGLA